MVNIKHIVTCWNKTKWVLKGRIYNMQWPNKLKIQILYNKKIEEEGGEHVQIKFELFL